MHRYFTRTFLLFLFGFLVIISIAFAIVAYVGSKVPPSQVDNGAQPS